MQKLRSSETSPGLHPPSAQKERAVDGARIFVTYYYYFGDNSVIIRSK